MMIKSVKKDPKTATPRPAALQIRTDLRSGCTVDDWCTNCKNDHDLLYCRNLIILEK